MYPEAGPSRPSSSYPSNSNKLPPTATGGPPQRIGNGSSGPGPSRREGEYERDRDERTNGYRSGDPAFARSSSNAIPPWQNRSQPRQGGYRPNSSSGPGPRPRSYTPSPPRRGYDRERERDRFDVRDRLSLDPPGGWRPTNGGPDVPTRRVSNFAPPPRERDINWSRDDRRWIERRDERDRDRDRDRDRFRDETRSSPAGRYPSERIPPPRSPPSAPRGPRSITAQTPPSYTSRLPSIPGPRTTSYTPARDDRDRSQNTPRPFDRSVTVGGPGPSSAMYAASQPSRPNSPSSASASGARVSRSQRGSSSPVESTRQRETDGPSSVPNSHAKLPDIRTDQEEQDLEEGEVISPVQTTRVPSWSYNNDDRSRRPFSPPRERDRWDRDRERDRDNRRFGGSPPSPHWAGRRNLDDSWNGSGRNRRRSLSNPTRWKPEDGEDLQKSPRKPLIPEEGEVAPRKCDESVRPKDEVRTVEEGKNDRPPTPPIPPTTAYTNTENAGASQPPKEANVGLQIPEIISRPDTPASPPPKQSTHPTSISQMPVDQLDEVKQTIVEREEMQIDRRPLVEKLEPALAVQREGGKNGSPSKLKADGPTEQAIPVHALSASDSRLADESKLQGLDLIVDEKPVSSMKVDEAITEESPIAMQVEVPAAHQADVVKELPSPNLLPPEVIIATSSEIQKPTVIVDGDLLNNSGSTIKSSDFEKDMDEGPVQRDSTPAAPTSPSESAVTHGLAAVIVEFLQEEQGAVLSPTSAAPLVHDKPSLTSPRVPPPLVSTSLETEPTDTQPSQAVRRVTIAERRAVQLPPTSGPLSSPFGVNTPRRDPMPTAYSTSTDAETEAGPKTGEIDERDTPMFEDAPEEIKQANLIAAIKAAQTKSVSFDQTSIITWNIAAAPEPTSRELVVKNEDRPFMLQKITWPLNDNQRIVTNLVATAIAREKRWLEEKTEQLKNEYLDLDEEWQEHCNFLDTLMEKRGQPPVDLYAIPGAILPVVTPGPIAPTTPLPEEVFNARGNRRRGVGDAVSTEAEFEAILAGLADTAAKDPTYRANKTSAVVPDMYLDEERKLRYDDDNDLIEDPLSFYDFKGNAEPIWTAEERALFVRRYMAYPKQFGRVADGIPNKTASDCVLYYYRTKKEVDYKGMLASKRGGGKKKTIPIKKGGKSSSLLADLDRQKPIAASEVSTPARGNRERAESIVPGTSAKKGKLLGNLSEGGVASGRKRKTTAASITSTTNEDGEEKLDSTVTSRAGSEVPSTIAPKSKLRMTVKTAKRPRASSTSDNQVILPAIPSTPSTIISADPAIPAIPAPDTATPVAKSTDPDSVDPAAAQSELLPPIKRAGKRRKVLAEPTEPVSILDPTATPIASLIPTATTPGITPTTDKPNRRSATNSYWSVEEKRKVKELVAVHGVDVKAIAAHLKGKSERQVGNFLEGHRTELVDGSGIPIPTSAIKPEEDRKSLGGGVSPVSNISAGEVFRSAQPTRTIYDAYPSYMNQDRYEPRLAMFPPSPPHAPGSTAGPDLTPLKPVSRTGGMRISALLNDDAPTISDKRPSTGYSNSDTIDAASDGTVDERDLDGMTRPSPRSIPPIPTSSSASASAYGRYEQRPDLDRYRNASSLPAPSPYPTTSTSSWSNGPTSTTRTDMYRANERAATTTPIPMNTHQAPPNHMAHRSPWPDTHQSPHAVPPIPLSAHRSNSYSSSNNRYDPIPSSHRPSSHDSHYQHQSQHHHHHHQSQSQQSVPHYEYASDRGFAREYPVHSNHPAHGNGHGHGHGHHANVTTGNGGPNLPPLNSSVGPPPLIGSSSGAATHRAYNGGD
ncbi:uncharacterized protein IL334_003109 [Kwoniella shivajii]|uniref:SANT domain-containing protein n=1 Tax=Kwoniella shivajii TaxID=564305 RepID=A0ABZ1CZM2_9TREE|nr:hypothetical protein IL334_003109 [Kwoniella shivajii]